jgi:hypothetical protein
MPPADSVSTGLFAQGPPLRFHRLLGLAGRTGGVRRRAIATAAVSWVPPFILTALGAVFASSSDLASFASEIAFHVRALLATPLLIVAEAVCSARLAIIAGHFLRSGLVSEDDRPRFDAAVSSTSRLRDSRLTECAVVVFAYAAAFLLVGKSTETTAWQQAGAGPTPYHSLAGWWEALVSLPILLALIFGWFWRLFLWSRFLWLVSRMNLKLVATHPDLRGGLGFVGHSLRALSPVALAFGSIVAGTAADSVLKHGTSVYAFRGSALGLVTAVLVLFCAPLFVFTGRLLECWRSGVFQYGAAATALGRELERKWLGGQPDERIAVDAPEFSTTNDLYSIVERVNDMRLVPLELKGLIAVVSATLLPFVPVVLIALPFDVIADKLTSFLR